jgi:hypothetical protein
VLRSDNREKSLAKQWAQAWQTAAPLLTEIRHQEVVTLQTQNAISALEDFFTYALQNASPRQTSGLVEMQKHLSRVR